MGNVSMVNELELAYKFISLYEKVVLPYDMVARLTVESHNAPPHLRTRWFIDNAGVVCEEGNTFRVIYPEKFTYAMLKYS